MAEWPYCWPWPKIREQVLNRDGHRCQMKDNGSTCLEPATDVDHIIPPNEGGAPFDPDNCRAACARHNRGRGQGRMAAMAKLNRQTNPEPSRRWH